MAKYRAAVTALGDIFLTPAFTTFGTPYKLAIDFFHKVAHTGDYVPASVGRDAPRFLHEASSWATPNHLVFMVHAAAMAAARASAVAIRDYARERTVDSFLLRATANLPPAVAPPVLH